MLHFFRCASEESPIIDEKIYYLDYEKITKKVLYDDVNYETSIKAIYKIIESGLFENI